MSNFNNFLASYNQVGPPDNIQSQEVFVNPVSKLDQLLSEYQNLKQNTRNEKKEPREKEENEISPFVGFTYNSPEENVIENNTPVLGKNEWSKQMIDSYKKLGLSDNAIRNLLAKNALESGWGKSAQGKYNYGNITAGKNWKGNYVNGKDHNAKGQKISQKFRSYNSMDEYVKDEIQFLTNLYDFNPNDSFDIFMSKLQGNNKGKRKYAEDPSYRNKVKSVYNSI